MKLFSIAKDGGVDSTVTGYWIVEIKCLFSIVLLKFDKGSREVFHSHSFHALTWFLSGEVDEHHIDGRVLTWKASFLPKLTLRSCFHKVFAKKTTWALSIRGPWVDKWKEYDFTNKTMTTLTHTRKILSKEIK